jgi:hypothetical protein
MIGASRPRAAGLVALLCGALAGCGAQSTALVDFAETPRSYVPSDYRTVYGRWTRTAHVSRDYDTSLDVSATLKSYDFRWAYAVRSASLYQLPVAEQEKLLARQLGELRAAHEVHLWVTAARPEWVDFARNKTLWRITLADDQGREVQPLEVRPLKTPPAEVEAFFPVPRRNEAFHGFYTPWLVRFPSKLPDGTPFITTETRAVTMRLAGVLGAAELRWTAKR